VIYCLRYLVASLRGVMGRSLLPSEAARFYTGLNTSWGARCMTIEEILRMQDSVSKRLEDIVKYSVTLFSEPGPSLTNSCSNALLNFCNISASLPYNDLLGNVSKTCEQFCHLFTNVNFNVVQASLTSFERIQPSFLNTFINILDIPYKSILDTVTDALEYAEPYLPPETKEECKNTVLPKLKSSRKLTLSDALAILSLLVTILFGILSSTPDEQMDRIIAQNERIIEQQAELIQLQKEDKALLDTLDSLSDSINLLSDEIELLREELESSGNLGNSPDQPDTENGQQ
jgi:hypothetical protein